MQVIVPREGAHMSKVIDFDPRKRRKWKAKGKPSHGPQRRYARKNSNNSQLPNWVPDAALATGIAILATAIFTSPMASGIGCGIKGNVSNTGERIFHIPGQEYYRETVVNPLRGERWFCTEEAAREAGWRKAFR
ncbi:hypothetical protein RLEG12_07895 (plasmid) [Rhizobium leguminosarum bv. trifolii CB782]|nr:hypothetical protein RLEG12_07895 [Rhizobium leguminosarum bv. trifolii CB782]